MDNDKAIEFNLIDFIRMTDRFSRSFFMILDQAFQRRGIRNISPEQAMLLFMIEDGGSYRSDFINRETQFGQVNNYTIRRLAEGGYIAYGTCPQDKRKQILSVTDAGRELLEIVRCAIDAPLNGCNEIGNINLGIGILRSLEGRFKIQAERNHLRLLGNDAA